MLNSAKTINSISLLAIVTLTTLNLTTPVNAEEVTPVNIENCKSNSVIYKQNFDGKDSNDFDSSPIYGNNSFQNGIVTRSYDYGNNVTKITKDATTGSDYFLMNATDYTAPNVETFWSPTKDIVVLPNSIISLDFKLANAIDLNNAKVKPFFNNVVNGQYASAQGANSWSGFNYKWQTGSATNLNLELKNYQINITGNDFGTDDIVVTQYTDCLPSKPVAVTSSSAVASSSAVTLLSSSSTVALPLPAGNPVGTGSGSKVRDITLGGNVDVAPTVATKSTSSSSSTKTSPIVEATVETKTAMGGGQGEIMTIVSSEPNMTSGKGTLTRTGGN
jgi:hypothetical protein